MANQEIQELYNLWRDGREVGDIPQRTASSQKSSQTRKSASVNQPNPPLSRSPSVTSRQSQSPRDRSRAPSPQSQGGTKVKVTFNKRTYSLREGPRGGHYIVVNGEKKYLH